MMVLHEWCCTNVYLLLVIFIIALYYFTCIYSSDLEINIEETKDKVMDHPDVNIEETEDKVM